MGWLGFSMPTGGGTRISVGKRIGGSPRSKGPNQKDKNKSYANAYLSRMLKKMEILEAAGIDTDPMILVGKGTKAASRVLEHGSLTVKREDEMADAEDKLDELLRDNNLTYSPGAFATLGQVFELAWVVIQLIFYCLIIGLFVLFMYSMIVG
jgi:hypothetical protein